MVKLHRNQWWGIICCITMVSYTNQWLGIWNYIQTTGLVPRNKCSQTFFATGINYKIHLLVRHKAPGARLSKVILQHFFWVGAFLQSKSSLSSMAPFFFSLPLSITIPQVVYIDMQVNDWTVLTILDTNKRDCQWTTFPTKWCCLAATAIELIHCLQVHGGSQSKPTSATINQ